ncbi:DNA internalization-related competence protein ComEC/Rec2 [Congregibacter brevis]|uniref:DNA internalization-related competence protein ComEC/Rec2 n=1 Tax=Congregibacter brevis TaxID=3081201 RepID=A0ABZ0IAB2_9GAMM|nr:DNA internalization-related competence protein ComEC/Rec2 [Congregibacter sp. IMCC45268]
MDPSQLMMDELRVGRSPESEILNVPSVLLPGATIEFEARLRRPWGLVNPAAQQGELFYLASGIHGVGSVSHLSFMFSEQGRSLSLGHAIDRLRHAVSSAIQQQVPGDVGALLSALAVGDRRAMTSDAWSRLRLFGLTHLMVISGMHVTLLAIPGWYLGMGLSRTLSSFRGAGRGVPQIAPFGALVFAGAYALISGFALPAQRALLTLGFVMLPKLVGRTTNSGWSFPIAVFGLFALNPLSILTPGFWLSVGAVTLLLWFTAWRGSTAWLRSLWSSQGYMILAMIPLSLFWFQESSSIGGVINLVAVPLVTFLVVPLLLSAIALAPLFPDIGSGLLNSAAILLGFMWSGMSHWEPVVGRVSLLQQSPGELTLFMLMLAVVLWMLPKFRGRFLVIALLTSPVAVTSRVTGSGVDITFFDVGQGTAVLVRQGRNALLYDTGGGHSAESSAANRAILPMFQSQGINVLDTLVISHPDNDHDGGESAISERTPPKQIRRGLAAKESEACRLGETTNFGESVTLRFLSQSLARDSDNNASCVLLVMVFGKRLLLAGDIASPRERELLSYWGAQTRADVLLSTHHGSAGSNSLLWLRSVSPSLMVVTAGRANRFGHPARRVVDDAQASGVTVINTATHGAVTLRISPEGRIQCRASRHRWAPFWRRGEFTRNCLPP